MELGKPQTVSSIVQPDHASMPVPFLYEDDGLVSLHFRIDSVQSQMRESAPDHLVLSYTRTMMAFQLFHRYPRQLAMIGLGGGSMAKWCHRHLPLTEITVLEINRHVIALRDRFYVPDDDERFRVLNMDGADYVASTTEEIDVLIVDGFDVEGQPPELCSQTFYDACYRSLTPSGVMVVNLCGWSDRANLVRINKCFDDRVLVVRPDDGSNRVVFACKGEPAWFGQHAGSFLMKLKEYVHRREAIRVSINLAGQD
jgi:spermidine synthase